MEAANDWKSPPWAITGENLTQWRRLVWKHRRALYMTEYNDKIRRENEKLELRRLQDG